jgi:subtilase family serine protease
MEVSHPESSKYGKHWTSEEVKQTFSPSSETIEAVNAWLASNGLQRGTEYRGYLSIEIPVADAERLFRTKYYEHEDHRTGAVRIGCDQYALPHHHSVCQDLTTLQVSSAGTYCAPCRLCYTRSNSVATASEANVCQA